jgi:ribosomal protein S11
MLIQRLFLLPAAGVLFAQPAAKVDFDREIAPILESKCYSCHGAQKQLAGLRLDRRQAALRGGDYGKVIVPGDSANSKLIHRISGSEAGMQMPPAGPLEPHEIALLRAWIDQGPDYGSSQLAVRRAPPRPLPAGWKSFVDAIVAGNDAAVRAALAADPSLATADDGTGTTALMHAAGRGGIDTMRVLLKAGANAAAANQRGATALTWALGDFEKVKLLLDAGAAVDQRTREGRTPLHIAAQQPARPEVLRALLAKGADAKAMDVAGMTPLHLAAGAGAEAYIRALVAAGANVNAVSGSRPARDPRRASTPCSTSAPTRRR